TRLPCGRSSCPAVESHVRAGMPVLKQPPAASWFRKVHGTKSDNLEDGGSTDGTGMRARLATGGSLPDHSASGVAHPQGRALVDLLLLLGVVAILSLSDFALEFFGIPYNSPGGSIIVKIHPATYLFVMALGLAVIANPNPIAYMFDLMARCLGSTFLLVACILLWIFISRFKGDQPASFLIDAIMVAAIIYMLRSEEHTSELQSREK